jgi:hypothetical protein
MAPNAAPVSDPDNINAPKIATQNKQKGRPRAALS